MHGVDDSENTTSKFSASVYVSNQSNYYFILRVSEGISIRYKIAISNIDIAL